MYNRLLILAIVTLGALLSACDASFVDPATFADTTKVPKVDTFKLKWFDTKANPYRMNGFVISNDDRCKDTLPPGSRIVIGWELPYYYGQKALYIYGTGSVDPRKVNFGPYADFYSLKITIDSILPKSVVWFNTDSTQALAIGHIFLVNTTSIKVGDTVLDKDVSHSDILGGVAETAIVFQYGTPVLLGHQLNNPLISVPGFNFLRGYKSPKFGIYPDPNDPNAMKNVYKSDPNKFFLTIDEHSDDTHKLNPFWLFP